MIKQETPRSSVRFSKEVKPNGNHSPVKDKQVTPFKTSMKEAAPEQKAESVLGSKFHLNHLLCKIRAEEQIA